MSHEWYRGRAGGHGQIPAPIAPGNGVGWGLAAGVLGEAPRRVGNPTTAVRAARRAMPTSQALTLIRDSQRLLSLEPSAVVSVHGRHGTSTTSLGSKVWKSRRGIYWNYL